jgi:hypothetical protein
LPLSNLSFHSVSHIERCLSDFYSVIKSIFGAELDSDEYAIQVSEWEAFSFQDDVEQNIGKDTQKGYFFHSHGVLPEEEQGEDEQKETETTNGEQLVTPIGKPLKPNLNRAKSHASAVESASSNKHILHLRSKSNVSIIGSFHEDPHLTTRDLWETDEACHYIAREGYYQTPTAADGSTNVTIEEGCHHATMNHHGADPSSQWHFHQAETAADQDPSRRTRHDRSHTFDARLLHSYNLETHTIKERLHGYVRPKE